MKNKLNSLPLRLSLVSVALALGACSSMPRSNQTLDEARTAYTRAAADANLVRSAPLELQLSQRALEKAETALRNDEDKASVDHFALIARQRVEVAVETGRVAAADKAVADAQAKRDQVVIAARTQEAQMEASKAQAARREAEASRMTAEAAREQSEAARKLAEQRLTAANAARVDANAARVDAKAALDQANVAREAAAAALVTANAERDAAVAARKAADAETQRAAALEAELKQMKATKTDRGMVLTLGDVLFDSGKATLKPGALRTVDQLARFLEKNATRRVVIEGHTDSVGGADFNRELSQRRADAVRQALVDRRVDGGRVDAKGLGEDFPIANNTTNAGRQQNRRVDVIFSDDSGQVKARK